MDKRSQYLRGVGVGLIIAWVTAFLAYWLAGLFVYVILIEFEVVASLLFVILAYILDTEKKNKKEDKSKND